METTSAKSVAGAIDEAYNKHPDLNILPGELTAYII